MTAISSSQPDEAYDPNLPLPFPTALPRDAFLAPDFHAPTYLATLVGRHQTLEDLRSDLRERLTLISTEVHELVNANWAEFLSLGAGLSGGEERVDAVRVSVLTFRRALEEMRALVQHRRDTVGQLCNELRKTLQLKETARTMIDLHDALATLESKLGLGGEHGRGEQAYFDNCSDDDEEYTCLTEQDADPRWTGANPVRLRTLAVDIARTEHLADLIGRNVPFVASLEGRISECRRSLLLDVWTGLKEARSAGSKGATRVMEYLRIYPILKAEADAVENLRN